jgi:hypothetical protein
MKTKAFFAIIFALLVLTTFVSSKLLATSENEYFSSVLEEGSKNILNIIDYGLDTNENGLYDYLVIEIELTIPSAGNYEIEGELQDMIGNQIEDDVEFEGYLEEGIHTIQLYFNGNLINQHQTNGPYLLEEIVLSDVDQDLTIEELHNAHVTFPYGYDDFENKTLEVTIFSPEEYSTITENFAYLEVGTSENSVCEYKLIKSVNLEFVNTPYELMEFTGGTEHSHILENLEETLGPDVYGLWVFCTGENGIYSEEGIYFDVDFSGDDITYVGLNEVFSSNIGGEAIYSSLNGLERSVVLDYIDSNNQAHFSYNFQASTGEAYNFEFELGENETYIFDANCQFYIGEIDESTITARFEETSSPEFILDSGDVIISESATGDYSWTAIGLDLTSHPEIKYYRIQWFSGGWSEWYRAGENDLDWKNRERFWIY